MALHIKIADQYWHRKFSGWGTLSETEREAKKVEECERIRQTLTKVISQPDAMIFTDEFISIQYL